MTETTVGRAVAAGQAAGAGAGRRTGTTGRARRAVATRRQETQSYARAAEPGGVVRPAAPRSAALEQRAVDVLGEAAVRVAAGGDDLAMGRFGQLRAPPLVLGLLEHVAEVREVGADSER